MPRLTIIVGVLFLSVQALGGCRGRLMTGSLQTHSLAGDSIILEFKPRFAVFAETDKGEASFWLSDQPLEDVLRGTVEAGQIIHIELLWLPKPGATPLDASATNASVRHVVMVDGELGLYGGAGFALPSGSLHRKSVGLSMQDASLVLDERTEHFRDLLTPARMAGSFRARRDEDTVRRLRYAVSQIVTDGIGRSIFVQQHPPTAIALGIDSTDAR